MLSELVEHGCGRTRFLPAAGRTGDSRRRRRAPKADCRPRPNRSTRVLPLVGIVREGLYLVLSAEASIGYATGFVRAPNDFGLAASRVTADGLGTADVSALGGRYTSVVPTIAWAQS